MKNVKSLLALLLTVAMVASLCVCAVSAESGLSYAEGTVLRMATGYNNAKTGLFFDAEPIPVIAILIFIGAYS